MLLLCSHVFFFKLLFPLRREVKLILMRGNNFPLTLQLFGMSLSSHLSHLILNSEASPHTHFLCIVTSASIYARGLGCFHGLSMQFQVRSHEEAVVDIRERTEFFSLMVTLYRSFNQTLWVSNFWSLKLGGGKGWFPSFSI